VSTQVAVKPKLQPKIADSSRFYDLIIIGGGPAGLAAAIYAGRNRLSTVIIEKMVLGGQASNAYFIENYPGFPAGISGQELEGKMTEQATKLGLQVIWGNVSKVKKSTDKHFEAQVDGKTIKGKTVIIATGSENLRLDVPGEEEFRGRGVSYCATCDGAFYKDKNLIVAGGGNSAIEEALYLTRFAAKVSIVHRRDELRADKVLAERAKSHPKIYFFWHSVVEEIKGDKFVKEAVLKDLLTGKKLIVPVDGIFIYIGSKPGTDFVKDLVKLDEQGYIMTDDKMKTSVEGIFAAGDVRQKSLRQIVTAVADGAIAAKSAREYIEKSAS
jgi:thioredoxin reductase (NADPH)